MTGNGVHSCFSAFPLIPLCAGRGRLSPSPSALASTADFFRPILMSSLNADGSPGYINAVFASVSPQPSGVWGC